jgi:hypothetical protein
MKIEILENRLSSDGFVGELGDRFTVPDEVGAHWCSLGWAKDLSGAVPTGERIVINAALNVQDVITNQNPEVK